MDSLKSYILGFGLSIALTFAAFLLVSAHVLTGWQLGAALASLALLQVWVQLSYFLHLGKEASPRWKFASFVFALAVVIIVVFGSLWIMYHLNYNMMSPEEMDAQLLLKEGIER